MAIWPIIFIIFVVVSFENSYSSSLDGPIEWESLNPVIWNKHKETLLGPLTIYKIKEKTDEPQIKSLLRKRKQSDSESEKSRKLEDDFYLFSHKQSGHIPEHMTVAYSLCWK